MRKISLNLKTAPTIKEIFRFQPSIALKCPLIGTEIPAGFPSPAQDYIEENLDLNKFLIDHPTATYFVKVEGYSMVDAGINPGDILIVDRAAEPIHKKVVIAIVDGELTVKRLRADKGRWFLVPDNPEFEPIEITKDMNFQIWGVVTYAIHKMK
ncbi:MAG: translesion error-prone DNA polymerase V autoproteolytic subunit [Candidatus Cloacimonetes bacterium]|nr:translesion error-prone DNA polymerase V autoproteolytic subunit [Candidatus Cloacimonadota bacterium]